VYFFDSSAIIEIVKGNTIVSEKYKEAGIITINLGYGEVYYYCIRKGIDKNKIKKITFAIVDYSIEDIEKAMELLYIRKKEIKDFSFIDSLIYTVAIKNGFILVTKDLGFKGLPNVELIAA